MVITCLVRLLTSWWLSFSIMIITAEEQRGGNRGSPQNLWKSKACSKTWWLIENSNASAYMSKQGQVGRFADLLLDWGDLLGCPCFWEDVCHQRLHWIPRFWWSPCRRDQYWPMCELQTTFCGGTLCQSVGYPNQQFWHRSHRKPVAQVSAWGSLPDLQTPKPLPTSQLGSTFNETTSWLLINEDHVTNAVHNGWYNNHYTSSLIMIYYG